MFATSLDFYHFVQSHLFCKQIAHIPSSSRDIEQKTISARYTAEATFTLRMRCCCQNTVHSFLSLDYLTAEYCAPVWCRSADTRIVDGFLHDALLIDTRCLRPIPIDNLHIFSSIQPTELRQLEATLSLASSATLSPTVC